MSPTVLETYLKEKNNTISIIDIDKNVCMKYILDKGECLEYLKKGNRGRTVIINDKSIGTIWTKPNEFGHIEITGFNIDPEYRGSGYGSLLLKSINAQVLYTEADNSIAQRVYKKNGWRKSKYIGRFSKHQKDKEWYLFYNPKRIKVGELEPYTKLEYEYSD